MKTSGGAGAATETAETPAASEPRPAGKRGMADEDLLRFVWVADPQISPDGRQVAFVRVTVNKKMDGYVSAIWMVPADGSSSTRPFCASQPVRMSMPHSARSKPIQPRSGPHHASTHACVASAPTSRGLPAGGIVRR